MEDGALSPNSHIGNIGRLQIENNSPDCNESRLFSVLATRYLVGSPAGFFGVSFTNFRAAEFIQ